MHNYIKCFSALLVCMCLLRAQPAFAEGMTFVYDQQIVRTEIKDDKTPPKTETKKNQQTIKLLPKKISVTFGDVEQVFDLDNLQIIELNHKDKTLYQTPLYSLIDYRVLEKKNRQGLNKVLQAVKKDDTSMSQFELETTFSMADGDAVAKDISTEQSGNTHRFSFNKEEVASFSLSDKSVPAAVQNSYRKYLLFLHTLHPLIRDALGEKPFLASQINYRTKPFIGTTEKLEFTLVSADENDVNMTFPHEYKRIYSRDKELNALLEKSADLSKMTSQDDYTREIAALQENGDYLGSFLAMNEYSIHYGGPLQQGMAEAVKKASKDSPIWKMIYVMQVAAQKKEAIPEAIKFLQSPAIQSAKHGYMANVFLANFYAQTGKPSEGKAHLLKALQENPYLTGAYKDLGMIYANAFQLADTWLCFEKAATIAPDHPILKFMKEYQEKLRADHPEYF